MNQINFVRRRRRELTKVEISDGRNFRLGLYGFAVILFIVVALMSVRFYLSNQLAQTNKSIDSLNQSIKQKQKVEDDYVLLLKKVEILTSLFGQRKEKQEALTYFSSLFDPEVIINSLSYDAETHTLAFALRAPSIFSMKKVFETLRSANVRQKYASFTIGSLTRAANGSYSMEVNLPLPTKPIISTDAAPTVVTAATEATTGPAPTGAAASVNGKTQP